MKFMGTILTALLLMLLSTGCTSRAPQSGDTLIPPVSSGSSGNSTVELNNSNSFSNFNNASNTNSLVKTSSDMIYTMLGNDDAPLSIFADNKCLYLLRSSGTVIEMYDVENASLIREISDAALIQCTAFTVKDSNIYAFDMKTGKILLFSSGGGFLSSYNAGLPGVNVEKIVVTKNRRIVMKIRETASGNAKLAILDIDTEELRKLEAYQLFSSSSSQAPDINDFSMTSESSALICVSSGRLCLFDIEEGIPRKSCIFSAAAGFMEFDGNVLYYSADEQIRLVPENTANFTNLSSQRLAGRILINSEFPWPETMEELEKWQLNDLKIPYADSGRHFFMAQNSKYLFFLDIIPESSKESVAADAGYVVYRIMK